MTCIVGIEQGGTVWLGGDRAGTNGALERTLIGEPKVFVKGGMGFGVCGSPKVMDALKHGFELPRQDGGGDDRGFLVSVLVPAIRAGLLKLDAAQETPGGCAYEGAMLLAHRGKLYMLEGNFQLITSSSGYLSVGSGASLALGALASNRGLVAPRKRILQALDVSAQGNAGVAPPFDVVVVKG